MTAGGGLVAAAGLSGDAGYRLDSIQWFFYFIGFHRIIVPLPCDPNRMR
jgi:hypothetical protein